MRATAPATAPARSRLRALLVALLLLALVVGVGIAAIRLFGGGSGEVAGFLKSGRAELARGTPASIARARELFNEAAARDPDDAGTHAQAALADLRLIESTPPGAAEIWLRAEEAATRAAGLDPELADAQAALGYISFFWRGGWPAGMERLDRAVALDPSSVQARHWRGLAILYSGDPIRALADLDIAFRAAPADRAIIADRGLALVLTGRADEGVAALRRLARDEPQYARVARNLALAHLARGDDAAWLEAEERAAILMSDAAGADAARAGRAALANGRSAALAAMLERTSGGYARARLLALLGRTDEALAALHQGRRDPAFVAIRIDPAFASLRADPRFRSIAASLG